MAVQVLLVSSKDHRYFRTGLISFPSPLCSGPELGPGCLCSLTSRALLLPWLQRWCHGRLTCVSGWCHTSLFSLPAAKCPVGWYHHCTLKVATSFRSVMSACSVLHITHDLLHWSCHQAWSNTLWCCKVCGSSSHSVPDNKKVVTCTSSAFVFERPAAAQLPILQDMLCLAAAKSKQCHPIFDAQHSQYMDTLYTWTPSIWLNICADSLLSVDDVSLRKTALPSANHEL